MKTFTKSSLLASTVIAGMAFATPAIAQDADEGVSADAAAPADDEIIITGTRIARPNVESASPVTVVGEEAIAQVGTTRVEDLVNSLPQVTPGQTAFVSNGATGTATVNLRGLGTARTLVLLNGRRLQPGDPFLPVADLNQIPASLVSRVEVLTGGASSTYGADAVAGVVNFIMDTDFEGVQLDATYGVYQHNNRDGGSYNGVNIRDAIAARNFEFPDGNVVDGDTFDAQLTLGAGFDDGRGNVVGYVGYRKIGEILQGDRDYSACAIGSSGACGGSSTRPNATITDPFFDLFTELTADGSDDFGFNRGIYGAYNYAPVNFFQRPDVRWTAGMFADYEISDSVEVYAEFMFMDDRSDGQIAESGTFFGEQYNIDCASPLLTQAQGDLLCSLIDGNPDRGDFIDTDGDGVEDTDPTGAGIVPLYIGKRNVEGGGRNADLRHTGYRAVAGVRGDITDRFSYDVSGQFGTTIYSNFYTNDLSFSRLRTAIQAVEDGDGNLVCADPIAAANGCVPYNPFQGEGIVDDPRDGITSAAVAYVSTPGLQKGEIEEWVVNGYITGSLFNITASEPVAAVIGAEYRSESLSLDSDVAFATGDLAGQGGPSPSVEGKFDVKEVFAELLVPLVSGVPGVDRLSLELGYRYSDYSTGKTTDTYKLAAEYSPIPEVKFRGGYNRAVRAANVLELFSPQGLGLWGGVDGCSGATPTFTQAQCANTGVSAAQYGNIAPSPATQYNQITGGNPNVEPETADTYTVGVVVEGGSILPGFVATVDYFNIEVRDAIGGIGSQTILNQCALTGDQQFCSLVNRAPGSGSLWAGQAGFIVNTNQNIGGVSTEGIDVGLSYARGLGAGRLNLDINGTYTINSGFDTGVGDDSYTECAGFSGATCGFPTPEWRHTARAAYNFDSGVGISLRWRHIGSTENDAGTEAANLKAYDYLDASVNFDVTDEFGFRVGVNNVFDTEPPLIPSAVGTDNANTWAGTYDPVGRFLFVSGTLRF